MVERVVAVVEEEGDWSLEPLNERKAGIVENRISTWMRSSLLAVEGKEERGANELRMWGLYTCTLAKRGPLTDILYARELGFSSFLLLVKNGCIKEHYKTN